MSITRCTCGSPQGAAGDCLACQSYDSVLQAKTLTADEFSLLCLQAGRNHGPFLLDLAQGSGVIQPDVVTAVIGEIWELAEFPESALDRDRWLQLFAIAGYTHEYKLAERPAKPVTGPWWPSIEAVAQALLASTRGLTGAEVSHVITEAGGRL